MADVLTPHERAAIDAFPRKLVRRIPVGVSGIPDEQLRLGLHWKVRRDIATKQHFRAKSMAALKAREKRGL